MPRSKPSTKSLDALEPKQHQTESTNPAERESLPPAEVLQSLPEIVRESIVESSASSRPLPPPSMYRAYDEVLPGSAERILRMAEREQDHRIESERDTLRQVPHQHRLGTLVALSSLGVAGVLAMYGHGMGRGNHWLREYGWDCSQFRSEASRLAAIPHGLTRLGRLRRLLRQGSRLDRPFALADPQQGS